MDEDEHHYGMDLKIIIVGDSSTGKTSIVNRYVSSKFDNTYKATIASQFSYKIIKIKGVIYRMQFWDLAGQDRTGTLASIFCKDSHGIVFCCDVTEPNSKYNILTWKKSLEDNIDISQTPLILMENKCDLLGDDEESYNDNFDDLKKFGEENGFDACFRTSALNGYGIEKAMSFLVNKIVEKFDEDDIKSYKDYAQKRRLSVDKHISKKASDKKGKCC